MRPYYEILEIDESAIQKKTLEILKKDYTKEEVESFFTITMGSTTGYTTTGSW